MSDPFKQGNHTSSKNIKKHDINRIKSFWFLNKDQQELVQQASEKTQLKNFCFVGGSGTGKTQMAIEVT
jgi:DNA replication protein DnaC